MSPVLLHKASRSADKSTVPSLSSFFFSSFFSCVSFVVVTTLLAMYLLLYFVLSAPRHGWASASAAAQVPRNHPQTPTCLGKDRRIYIHAPIFSSHFLCSAKFQIGLAHPRLPVSRGDDNTVCLSLVTVQLIRPLLARFFEDLTRTYVNDEENALTASFSKSRNLEDMTQFPSNFSVIQMY